MMVANTTPSSADRSEELKKDAENLATIAVQDSIAATQIRGLYEKIRTRGIADFQVYLKYQMGRNDSKYKVIISRRFGDTLLSHTNNYQKLDLVTLLKYTVMLYDYTQQTITSSRPEMSTSSSATPSSDDQSARIRDIKRTGEITDEVKRKIEQVVKASTSEFGFMRIDLEPSYHYDGRRKLKINVRLNNFRGDPKELSLRLASSLSSEITELSNMQLYIWIERGGFRF